MRILITGGTGLIGRALCPALLQAGHQVTVLSRHPDSVTKKCGSSVTPLSSLAEWHEGVTFDAIINLAGEPIIDAHWSTARKKLLWDSRVTLTQELVKRIAACTHQPSVLLSGSAVGYYGDRGDVPLDESASASTDFAAQLCAAWEAEAEHASQLGVRVCLLRTGLVLSSQGGVLHRMLLPFKLGLGARLGDGRQWMSWIHIDDYVAIVLKLLSTFEASGPFNMTAPHPVTNREFTTRLAAALHRPACFVAPARLLALILGPRKILLLGGQNVLPIKLLGLGFSFKYSRLETALQALLSRHP
jgi:uncharacterized protein (TIGR01777 family)